MVSGIIVQEPTNSIEYISICQKGADTFTKSTIYPQQNTHELDSHASRTPAHLKTFIMQRNRDINSRIVASCDKKLVEEFKTDIVRFSEQCHFCPDFCWQQLSISKAVYLNSILSKELDWHYLPLARLESEPLWPGTSCPDEQSLVLANSLLWYAISDGTKLPWRR